MKKIIVFSCIVVIVGLGLIYLYPTFFQSSNLDNPIPTPSSNPINLYYYFENLDKDETGNILCSEKGLVPVERSIPASDTVIEDSIRLLIKGELSQNEKSRGITTEFPLSGFEFIKSGLQAGTLTLTFKDPEHTTSGGACRVQILRYQIEATAKQFGKVSEVIIEPSDLFQP